MDQASATDLRGRIAWRELLEHVRKGGIDLVLVTKLTKVSSVVPTSLATRPCLSLYAYLLVFDSSNASRTSSMVY